MRLLWLILGGLSLICGLAGIVLPLVPTVPFMILAAFCFARSSERMHDWMLAHPTFGPPIQDWRTHGAISTRGKKMATLGCVAVLLITVILGLAIKLIAVQIITLSCVMIFIWTRPTAPR
ncbi:YbaN family protein [Pseudooceanicola sp. C21-150M6]|uniref:YbaN family protein n=1 Tax=Pseudooceanicola sp. C21-150M6 TaxID=3434355 RepID=UPI003D7F64F5